MLKNLGLEEGSVLPVGVPIPWPSAIPPKGWLKCNGAVFTAAQYPKLAQAYPLLKLPDLRGEFIRGWDDGRGIDNGRTIISAQYDEFKSHKHRFINEYGTPSENFIAYTDQNNERLEVSNQLGARAHTYIGMENTGGSETRPRNIAFNYIVRAA
ncbi:phage tail protein [Pragia fontium]|uniref:phage tail protein n=1 Tax=Pragia fontium TaxID=82985 RepID=UPI000E0F29B5|nr:phage tail protein [Pragia fontium]